MGASLPFSSSLRHERGHARFPEPVLGEASGGVQAVGERDEALGVAGQAGRGLRLGCVASRYFIATIECDVCPCDRLRRPGDHRAPPRPATASPRSASCGWPTASSWTSGPRSSTPNAAFPRTSASSPASPTRWCAGAPTFAEVRREVLERLDGHVFVAHNARFDYGFLKHEFRRVEMTLHGRRALHGAPVAAPLPGSHRPRARCAHRAPRPAGRDRGREAVGAHRPALGARRRARHLALRADALSRARASTEIEAAVKRLLKIPSLPPQLAARRARGTCPRARACIASTA